MHNSYEERYDTTVSALTYYTQAAELQTVYVYNRKLIKE